MKRVKKNHIIITALAIMIAAAGYSDYIEALRDEAVLVQDSKEDGSYEKENAKKLLGTVDIMQKEYN